MQGKVTLNVRRMPLPEVLRRIGEQTFSRSSALYPLYSNGKSLEALKQSLRGEIDPATHGWTNLQGRSFGPGPGGMPGFGLMGFAAPGQTRSRNQRVSLNILGKDVSFATLALNRFAQARVVPEDGTTAVVNLTLKQATVRESVAKLAKAAQRKWTQVYALQPMFGPGGPGGFERPPQFADRNGNGPRGFGFGGPGGPDATSERRDEFRKQRETLEEELKQVLPAEERQKVEQAQQEREQLMGEMANMTPEQRRDRMMNMNGADMARMQRDRILNSTPEQRAQMSQRMSQRRAGGPGGPPR